MSSLTSRLLVPRHLTTARGGLLLSAATACRTPLSSRQFSSTAHRDADFTHAVIGGGVVGLAIARRLQLRGGGVSTVLIEKHGAVGTETSSRNSEVSFFFSLTVCILQGLYLRVYVKRNEVVGNDLVRLNSMKAETSSLRLLCPYI